ncbi:hypothetical protein [Comamonas sp. MYb69]|uniref:hypothetical protein n=1 Tax=Comamonas sp. MYb69 TaxID=1848650 RepID=UPI0030B1718B
MTTGVILRILACIALFATGALVNGWRMSSQVAKCEAEQSQGTATRAEAARTDETQTAIKESKHAQDTIYNADRLAAFYTGIADVQRRELAYAERVQRGAASRAATYNAQAQADAAARSDLADKAAALDRQLAEGLGVVASLGGDLRRRDAEVAALCDQVNIERRLSGDDSDQACSQK